MLGPSMNVTWPPSIELLQFYVNALRDLNLDLWPFNLKTMSRDAMWCSFANFEVEMTNYVSRVSATTVFYLPPA